MTTRISEIVRGYLGWCPGRMIAPHSRIFQQDNLVSSTLSEDRGYTMQEVILDYGSTGMSIPVFTLIIGGTLAGLFAIMRYGLFETWSSLGILMMSVFMPVIAVRMFYRDIKKTSVEFTPDTIIFRRPLSGLVIIAKDAITAIEVRKNIHHTHRWLSLGATVFVIVGVIPTILFSGESQYTLRIISRVPYTVFVVYYLAVIMFFGFLFYHGYIRSRYSHVLAISTNDKKIVGLYVDDPGRISETLSKWRAGEV